MEFKLAIYSLNRFKWLFLAIFGTGVFSLTAEANMCRDLFSPTKLAYSPIISIQDKRIYSNEGDIYAIHSKDTDKIIIVSENNNKRTVLKIKVDHIFEIKNNFLIGKRKNEPGLFVFDLKTGDEVYHAEKAEVVFKQRNADEIALVSYPKINGFSKNQGRIELIYLPDLHNGVVNYKELTFHVDHEIASYGFMKVQLNENSSDLALIRKSDTSVINIDANFSRAYEVKDASNAYVIQTTSEIKVYRNNKLDLILPMKNARDMKILMYSKNQGAYVGYDTLLKKFIKFTVFKKDSFITDIGPKVDISQISPKLVNENSVVFQDFNGKVMVWNLSENSIAELNQ